MSTKFALYDFNGSPREFYVVEEVEVPKPVLEPTVSHHIVIVDRSGSMYGVMNDTKAMVEKVMVAEEFTSSDLILTLLSYSSKGDYTVHFARQKVSEVLDPKNPHVAAIRNIRATCLTSVSGALDESLKHVQAGETTCITVHTDGYFNDASPAAEAKAVDKWIKAVQKDHANVYVNTVAYGNWTDFKMLDRISQSLSGKTVVAKNVRQVYDALHDTSALLAGRVLPAIHVPAEEDAFLAFHNVTQRKVNGAATDFKVKGVGPEDATKLYRFKKVAESTWKKSKAGENADPVPAYVFARVLLGQQRLNDAKYALVGTRDAALIAKHYKALTASALAEMATDLEARIEGDRTDYALLPEPGLGFDSISVIELGSLLQKHRGGYTLNLPMFLEGYKRRGVARVDGRWVDGVFVLSQTRLVSTDDAAYVEVTAFELNNATANINMQVSRAAELHKNGEKVSVVAGKKLDLREIRSYTLVGDGEINAPCLPLNLSSKKLHAELVKAKVLEDAPFDPKAVYRIDLAKMPACPFGQALTMPTVFEDILLLTIRRGLLAANVGSGGGAAEEWTEEQLEEIKDHDLSASLNYNPPTTNPYTDLMQAITDGEVDSYTTYNITLGDARMVSVKALYSANEYLARRFTVVKDGEELKKPKFSDLRSGNATVTVKALSARTKLNGIDDLMFPIYEAFLLGGGIAGLTVRSETEALAAALSEAEERLEALYDSAVRPVAFTLGATGLVPEGWTVEVLDAEGLKAKHPDIDIEKKQLEGTFLRSPEGRIIGIFPEVAYFSTPKGVERARALSKTEA